MKHTLFIFTLLLVTLTLSAQPLDDIVDRTIVKEKRVLAHQPLHERDLLWEKRIWRVVDVREKMNLPFLNPQAPFFEILVKAAERDELSLFSPETDDFTYPLSVQEVHNILVETDTVEIFDQVTYDMSLRVVENQLFYEDIKRYRIKEQWYFDSKTSTLQVRILGIAPLIEVRDDNGNFRYEKPLFWVHYPSARETLARHTVFNSGNDGDRKTWEDLFEMRHFASSIYKESNVSNNRLEDLYSGVDLLLQADKINQTIFNYEHDLWSY